MSRAHVLVLIALFAMSCAHAGNDPNADVLAVIDRLAAAGIHRDVSAIEQIYADDYFHTNPDGSIMDRAAVLASYRAPTPFSFDSSRRQEERVLVHGDSTVVNLISILHGKRGEDAFTSRYRVTYTLYKSPGGWRVINSHATLLGIVPDKK
jgi:ketosteroid isomerase-like protein